MAIAETNKTIRVWQIAERKLIAQFQGDYVSNSQLARAERDVAFTRGFVGYRQAMVEAADKERKAQLERVRKAGEAFASAEKAFAESGKPLDAAKAEQSAAEKALAETKAESKTAEEKLAAAEADLAKAKAAAKENATDAALDDLLAKGSTAERARNALSASKPEIEKKQKAAQESIGAAKKKITEAEQIFNRLRLTNAAAENELHFGIAQAQRAIESVGEGQNALQIASAELKQAEAALASSREAFTNSLRATRALAFSTDGRTLTSTREDGTLQLWSVDAAQPLLDAEWRLERVIAEGIVDRVNAVRFSRDGQLLATGGGEPSRSGELKIWRVKDGRLLHDLPGVHSDTVLALAFSPDGRFLVSGAADRFAKVIDLASTKVTRVLEGHTHHVLSIAWRRDGHTLATAGADNVIKIWDAFTGEKKKNIDGFNKEATNLGYLADTDQILASCGDATLRLVKDNGERVRAFEGATDYLHAAAATPDGKHLLAGGQDGVLRVWRADGTLANELKP